MARLVRISGPARQTLENAIKDLKSKRARAGWFETAKYEDGTPVASVAAGNEYGSPDTPPRPFMRPTVAEKKPGWAAISRQVAKNVVNGAQTATQMMDLLGMKVSGDIAKTITQLTSPPLKPATIRNRLRKRANQHTVGSLDKPLVDSGIMLGTLSHDVEDI